MKKIVSAIAISLLLVFSPVCFAQEVVNIEAFDVYFIEYDTNNRLFHAYLSFNEDGTFDLEPPHFEPCSNFGRWFYNKDNTEILAFFIDDEECSLDYSFIMKFSYTELQGDCPRIEGVALVKGVRRYLLVFSEIRGEDVLCF